MPTTLSTWLAHLESLSAQRLQTAILEGRIERFARLIHIARSLSLLPVSVPVITVAGTNGKGSCVAVLSSILHAAGHRVATFTSPHLVDYNERIQINQAPVKESILCAAFLEVERARCDQTLGYFEFTLLVSLWIFKHVKADVIVLEVGIGGRSDAVNIVDADIAIITSIDLDHTNLLGNTLESIAFEKAGIMRANKPCIWGDTKLQLAAKSYAKASKTPLFVYGEDFDLKGCERLDTHAPTWTFRNDNTCFTDLPVPTISYLPNAACALEAIHLLTAYLKVSPNAIQTGLTNTFLPGRFQVIPGNITTILDVAHNPASAALLADNLARKMPGKRVLMVAAMLNTKDVKGILWPLLPRVDAWYLGALDSEQSVHPSELAMCLESLSVPDHTTFLTIVDAYQAALVDATADTVIVVMGSFRTVGAVMQSISARRD